MIFRSYMKTFTPILFLLVVSCFSILSSQAQWVNTEDQLESSLFKLDQPRVLEPWRWSYFTQLDGYLIYCGAELDAEHLLFATDTSLLIYDGYDIEEILFPEPFRFMETFALWIKDKSTIYLNTSIGLIFYHDGNWSRLSEYEHFYPQERPLFAENKQGLLVTGTPWGVIEINGDQTQLLAKFEPGIGSLLASNGMLFISPARSSTVFTCDFDKKSIADVPNWKEWNVDLHNEQGLFLFKGNSNGTVFAHNFVRNCGIYRLDAAQHSWTRIETDIDYSDESFFSGISTGNEDFIIFAKSSNYFVEGNKAEIINRSKFKQPINSVFAFRRTNGNIIIGGRSGTIAEIDLGDTIWRTFINLHFECEDNEGHYWFIDRDGVVWSANLDQSTWQSHKINMIDTPTHVFCSSDGTIWVSGAHEQKAAVSRSEGHEWTLESHQTVGSRIGHQAVLELKDGRILFGSGEELPSERSGLVVYQKNHFGWQYDYAGLPVVPVRVADIVETEDGTLWTGAYDVSKIDPALNEPCISETSIHFEWVDGLETTRSNKLYAGFWEKGLFSLEGNEWKRVELFKKNSSHMVSNLLRDNHRNAGLWIATNSGISFLDESDCVPGVLTEDLGFSREEGTLTQSQDGSLWVNKTSRSWYFSDRRERIRNTNPFYSVRFRPENDAPRVTMSYFESKAIAPADIQLQWKGIDKWSQTGAGDLRYSYRFNDGQWSDYTSQTETILLNLKSGSYRFEVRAKDKSGNIGQLASPVEFKVSAPVWRQPWFIIGGLLMVSAISLLVLLLIRQRVRHLLEVDELKIQFFTNMSHELRTPLMLIISPLETLLDSIHSAREKKQIQTAYSSARKMLHLVDQILEFRKIEYGKTETQLTDNDIIIHLKEIIQHHQPLAEEKRIQLVSSFSRSHFPSSYDSDKLERVISNLISNAVKYTFEMGTIITKVSIIENSPEQEPLLEVKIEDDGMGIESEKLHHIFEPFYRITSNKTMRPRGVGLGLSLVKSLLDVMGGSIKVESPIRIDDNEHKGARFTVSLPLHSVSETQKIHTPNSNDSSAGTSISEFDLDEYSDESVVLLVEDDREVREYMAAELMGHFKIFYASNGCDGFEKAKEIVPDLIVTDVLMPEMDGKEMCRKIRADEFTSHIPIIVLTALKSAEHEMELLKLGADDFLSKPVSLKLLRQKISNAIKSREKLQENYRLHVQHPIGTTDKIQNGSAEDAFVEKTKKLIEEHLEDPFFDVEKLATLSGMSRMTLYRKIKAITGDSPSEMVRITRLNFAAKLLMNSDLNVSEIADRVGFQDLSHFSGTFKKHFHVSPSQYGRQSQKQEDNET